ncbi:tRNA dihydrouridine synthase DusB [bacterium]|nr:tRNA dihydrouridine synthase DusB [bacterium]
MKSFLNTLFAPNSPAVIAAPLAGVTDAAYQRILLECQTPLISTEMLPTTSLSRQPKALKKLLSWQMGLHPINAQIYGYSPEQMVKTIGIIADYDPDVIDINMGCPAKKIFKNAAGLALMKDLPRAAKIVRAVRNATDKPLSIKIRLGIKPDGFKAVEFAQMAETEGANFITVHARYRTTYNVPAEWDKIAEVKAAISIPVIGNGDIFKPEDAKAMVDQTGCDGVMIARGILGNPWLPRRTYEYLRTGEMPPEPTLKERFQVFSRHMDYLIETKGDRKAGFIFRKHAAWYLKGFPNIARFRQKLFTFSRPEQFYGPGKELIEFRPIPNRLIPNRLILNPSPSHPPEKGMISVSSCCTSQPPNTQQLNNSTTPTPTPQHQPSTTRLPTPQPLGENHDR